MDYFQRKRVQWLLVQIPGWLLLLSGMALLAVTLLLPSWLECRELTWKRDVMRLQAQRLRDQEQAYVRFCQALKNNDPVVLERLAYYQLRLRPAGATTLLASNPAGPVTATPVSNRTRAAGASAAASAARLAAQNNPVTVESMLHQPMPRVGVDYQPLPAVNPLLARLASGKTRLIALVAGLVAVAIGLIPAGRAILAKMPLRPSLLSRIEPA